MSGAAPPTTALLTRLASPAIDALNAVAARRASTRRQGSLSAQALSTSLALSAADMRKPRGVTNRRDLSGAHFAEILAWRPALGRLEFRPDERIR